MTNYILYKVTHRESGKVYIGYTSQEIHYYWDKHVYNANGNQKVNKARYFYKALRKYGKEAFDWEIIAEYNKSEDVKLAEIEAITKYKSNIKIYGSKFGYNMTSGGDGHFSPHSEETKIKISKSHFGLKHTIISKMKMSKSKKGKPSNYLGKKTSQEIKNKQSIAKKGKPSNNKGKLKVTMEQIQFIKYDYSLGFSYRKIARKFGISPDTVKKVVHIE